MCGPLSWFKAWCGTAAESSATRAVLETHHDARVLGAPDDGREDSAGSIVTANAGLWGA